MLKRNRRSAYEFQNHVTKNVSLENKQKLFSSQNYHSQVVGPSLKSRGGKLSTFHSPHPPRVIKPGIHPFPEPLVSYRSKPACKIRLPLIGNLFIYRCKPFHPLMMVDKIPAIRFPPLLVTCQIWPQPPSQAHTLLVNSAKNQQVITKSWALQPRSATASSAPTATQLSLSAPPSPLPEWSCQHVTFSFRSALRSPLPQRPPLAPRQLSKYAARPLTVSLQRRAFTRTLLPSGSEQRGGQDLPPPRVGGGGAPGGRLRPLEPEPSRRGSVSRLIPHFSGLRGPPGGCAFSGEPQLP